MRPILVTPFNDPAGLLFPHIQAVTPLLKQLFSQAVVTLTRTTADRFPQFADFVQFDPFFLPTIHHRQVTVGEDFKTLYQQAVAISRPDQILHLGYIDRLAFGLQSNHRRALIADIQATRPEDIPLLFTRSAAAWTTHPHNYREIEMMLTTAGRWLFGRDLDFAWCHLVLQAGDLAAILPRIHRPDMSMVAEPVLYLYDRIQTREVDWLAWEDPIILGREAAELKLEREADPAEVQKRFGYVIPMLQLLSDYAGKMAD